MASPSIIENDKGTPKYLSPDIERNKSIPLSMKRIPVNIGASIETNLPLNASYLQGYATERLQLDARTPEQFQYQAQSTGDAFKNGLMQLGAEAILGTVKSAATLLDLPQYVNIAMNKEKEFNTVFGEYIDELSEGVRENNPVFGTEEVELANPKFWASLLPDLGTTVSLFIPTGAAVKGLSLITKGIIGANKAGGLAGKVANHMLKNRETYKGVGAAMISRTMESSLEAEGTLKESYEKYLSEGYGDEQAKEMAGEDARNTYVANLPLVLLDAIQYTSLYKGMFNPLRGARAAERALANTTSNAILKAARGVYKAGKAVSGIAMESGEELLQFGIQKEADKSDSGIDTLFNAISNLPNYVSDPEAQKAMISGAFGGGVFEGLSYAQRKLFKQDAEIDNDLEAGRVAGAHYKSMKTFMDIMDEDRIKKDKLTNEGKADQYISRADSFLEAATFDTDSFTPEDIDNLTKLKYNYNTKTLDYINKGFSGDMLNKIVEEDMKATIFSNLEEKLKTTKPNSPQLTDKELRLKALNLLEEMEFGNTNLMKSSKLRSAEILQEVKKEKALVLAEMQADSTTFDPVKLNRKIKPDSKYREALTVQSNIETARILANIANNKLEGYNNNDKLIDDIEIDKIIDNYENLVDYREKFKTFDEYLDYLDSLTKEEDEDLNLVINTIYDELIEESLIKKEELNPKLLAKVKDTDLLKFNKDNLAADPNAKYNSVVSTPINVEQSNIYLTGKKDIASGLLLQNESGKRILVLSKGKDGVKILRDNKVEVVSEESINTTTKLGTYRTADVNNNKYIVTNKALINVANGSVKTNFSNLADAIEFRRATLSIFSTSSIAKIENDRKNELRDSNLKIRDAEKLYPRGEVVPISSDKKVTIHKKTLGINPSDLIYNGLYTFKFVKNGKEVDRIFIYDTEKGLVKQIKDKGTLINDPNYSRINDKEPYISYQELDYADRSERDFKNLGLINKKYDEKYVEEVDNGNISIESALALLSKFNNKPHKAVIKTLEDKIDLKEKYNIQEELDKNLKDIDSSIKTVNDLLQERDIINAAVLSEIINSSNDLNEVFNDEISSDFEVILIPEGKAIPITLIDGSKLQLTSNDGIVFLRDKKTNKIELSVLSDETTDIELIRLSVGQAFVEKVLGIPVYNASVLEYGEEINLNKISLLSIFTYDNTKMPYNSGYDFINANNKLSDKDSIIEELKKKYERLNNHINDLINKEKTSVEELANIIEEGLKRIDKNTDTKLTTERSKLVTTYRLFKSNPNTNKLIVVNKDNILKANRITLEDGSTTTKSSLKEKYKGKFIYATPGSGKTTIAQELDDVIDTDDLMIEVMSELNPEFVKDENQSTQDFILEYVKKYKNKDEVNKIVLGRIMNLIADGKTVLTGTIAFLPNPNVDIAFSVDNKNVRDRLKDKLDNFKTEEAINLAENINDLRNELLDNVNKSNERIARVKESNINRSTFFGTDGYIYKPVGFDVLIGEREVKADVDSNNNVTLNDKLPRKNSIVKIRNQYTKTFVDDYYEKIPLVLNDELKGSVIHMDEALMALFFNNYDDVVKDVNTIKQELSKIGVYFYDDLLETNGTNTDNVIQNILDNNQAVIKVLNTNNPELITGVKSKIFRVSPKTLLDFTLDKYGVDNLENARPYVELVNNFTTALKGTISSEVVNYNDLEGKLFTIEPNTEIKTNFSNLTTLLNTKLRQYSDKFKRYTLDPIPIKVSDTNDNVVEEFDTYMQSDLYETTPISDKAYPTTASELKVSEQAERWLGLFNENMNTNYTIDELSKLYFDAEKNSIINFLYIDANTVIGFIKINDKNVPIGLLDTLSNVIAKKERYNIKIVPVYLENLWKNIGEKNLSKGAIVNNEKDFVINDIHYTGVFSQSTTIGELIKASNKFSNLAIYSIRKNDTKIVYGNKDMSTSDIVNYDKVISDSDNSSRYYITVKVSNSKYKLFQIGINELLNTETFVTNNIETIKTGFKNNKNKFIRDNFFHFGKIETFAKDSKNNNELIKNILSDNNSLKNVVSTGRGLWNNPSLVRDIRVNIGVNGYLNTNFIINSKEKQTTRPTGNRRRSDTKKRFSRARGLVTTKLSRENALNNLKRILPEGYDVRFYENLIKEGNDYLWGYVSGNVIGLSDQGRIGTDYHEAFHIVFGAFINQTERERLLNHVKNYYKSRLDNSYTEEQLNDPDFAEELLADLYRDFALAYDEQGNKSLLDWIKDIPNAIIRFFKRLFNLETTIQRDKQKLDKFFKSISTGTFTNRNAELINSFKASKASKVSSIYKNGTEKQQIVNMLNSLSAQMNVYDLSKPNTIINKSFLNPVESVLTNIENKNSLLNVFVSELNRKLQLSEDEGGFIMTDEKLDVIRRIVKGLRVDLDVKNNDNVLNIIKLEIPPKFGEIPSSMMATFAEHGYTINDIDIESLSEIEFDDSNEGNLERVIDEETTIDEEEANQKENYQIKNYINPPHLKIRGVAKSFLSLIQKDEVDMFGFNINFNYTPQEAANKFLLAFGNTDTPIQLKEKILSRKKTEEAKQEEFRDYFYMDLYKLIEEDEILPKEKVYNSLWDTLGKLAKADFYNVVISQAGESVKVSRTMANLDDLKYKIKTKLFNIVDIKQKYSEESKNLPSNAGLVIQFGNTINVEELNAAKSFEELSDNNKKAIVALMNYIGYNDSFENENYTSIYSLDYKNELTNFIRLADKIYKIKEKDNVEESKKNNEINKIMYEYRYFINKISSKLPSDISSTHKTVDGKLYYEWQVPNAVNRIVKELNTPISERLIVDRLYENLPLMESENKYTYEESNGTIDKIDGINKEVSNYTAKDLLTEIIVSAQDGSFITPILSDSGRQVYIGGINFMNYDNALSNLLKVALIENNRKLTEGTEDFKNYGSNQTKLYLFPTIEPKHFPTEITDFSNFNNDIISGVYNELKNEIEKVINQRTDEFVETLNSNNIYLDSSIISSAELKNLSDNYDRAKTIYANHILNHIQLTYILIGDPAYYKNYEDLVKRAKQMISPSSISNIYNTFDIGTKSNMNYYDNSNIISVSENMTVSIKKDIERKSLNDEQLKLLGLEDDYKNNNLSDAQSYIDDIAHRDRLIAEGTFTPEHQEYMDYSMNGYPASKLTIKKALKTGKSIEEIKKQSPVEVIKPFYYAMINYIKNGREYTVPFQKKDSEFKISPFYGLKTINGIKNTMYNSFYYKLLTEEFGYTIEQEKIVNGKLIPHRIGYNKKNRKADVVSFESAIKVFTDKEHIQSIDNPFDKDKTITVPFKYWGRQVETPQGHFNKDISFGTQIRKLLVSRITGTDVKIKRQNGTINTPNELLKEYNQLLIEDIKRGEARFKKSISNDSGAFDGKKILNLIKSEFLSRKKPLQYLEALELLNNSDSYEELITRVPISHPFHTLQIQTILNSLHRNKVNKLKFKNGFKLANASSVGFERQPQIVFNNPANSKEGIKHFEVYAPIHDTRLYEFVDEESGLIPEERMSEIETKYPGILDGVVYRIPTEEKYSMYKTKIIGFVVDEVGAIFMPDVVTTRSGLDFDIDKMFGFFKDGTETTIDGKKYIGLTPEQYARKSKYAIDTIEFNNDYNDYQAQVISDNAKLDIMMDILSSEYTTIPQMKPGGFEAMENHASEMEYIAILREGHINDLGKKIPYTYDEFKALIDNFKQLSKLDKRNIVKSNKEFWNIVNISNTINRMNVGKQVLGIAANYNSMSAIVENETITEIPTKVVIKNQGKEEFYSITYNDTNLSSNTTSLYDLDNNLKYESISMLNAASADNGKTPTLEPLGIDKSVSNLYIALTGFGFPRRIIEKLLVINKLLSKSSKIKDIIEQQYYTYSFSDLDLDITEDKLERILFNPEDKEVTSILFTVMSLLTSSRTTNIGSNMSELLKFLKVGDNGLQSNFFDNMMSSINYDNYRNELIKNGKNDYLKVIDKKGLFSNESNIKMFSGLDIISGIAKIPKEFGTILNNYKIKPENYLDFYSAVYAYITRTEYEAFMSPQQVTDSKLKDKKIKSILNVVNHLKDFKEVYPDNMFLKQLSVNDTNKVVFTEQRKKDDSLINTTMNDFENLLNSDEVIEVKDTYDNKFVSIKVSDFANDLAYYSIQSYGFGYNYESFSYVIPPAYYDNHEGYVSTIDNKVKDYISNSDMFNNIFIEYALNNPRSINRVLELPMDITFEDKRNYNSMVDTLSQIGSFAYQPVSDGKQAYNNVFLFNNLSFISFKNELFKDGVPDLVYKIGKEYIVKVNEKNGKSYFAIADINKLKSIDFKALNNTLDKLVEIHHPNESKSKQIRLKDYGMFTQEFYLKSFNKSGIKFKPKVIKEVVEKGTDTPEITTVLNTEVLPVTNMSESKSEIIRLLSDISKTSASSIEDVINGNLKYDNKVLDNFTNVIFDKTNNTITITERNYLEQEQQQTLSDGIAMLKEVLNDYNKNKQVEVETLIQQFEIITPQVNQDKIVNYTPIGKTQQAYTIRGNQIFNKDGNEVFKEGSKDRNKIFANLAIQEKRAVIVTWKDNRYVVNNNNKIISVKTGDIMKWGPENGDYKGVIAEANKLFKSQQPEPQIIIDETKPEFNKLPNKSTTPTMTYAGIGSRKTPQEVLDKMTEVSKYLDDLGYTLQTGFTFKNKETNLDEEGADKAFSDGSKNKTLFGPYDIRKTVKGIVSADTYNKTVTEKSSAIVKEVHPAPDRLTSGAIKLMARNTNQIFGKDLSSTVDFVVFYAKETSNPLRPEGGTGQAVEMARRKSIPTINMANDNWRDELRNAIVKPQQSESQTGITIKDRIDILEFELKELETLKKEILENTLEVIIANNLPKITPDSAKKETGGKIGVNKDINPNLLSKDGVSVERAAEDINNDYPDIDVQDIRNYIIDILQIGVVNFVNRYTNQNRIDSIKNEIAELKRNKSGQLNLFDDYDKGSGFDNDSCLK